MKRLFLAAMVLSMASCNIQAADVAQAKAAAERFYAALESGDRNAALAQFSPEFKGKATLWPELLGGLDQRVGRVTSATLQTSSLGANGHEPCFSLAYAVKRGTFAANEILFICRRDTSVWLIEGHEITRLDTHNSISGGVLPLSSP